MEPCCTHRWTDKMGHNLKAIMKVMRFAVRRGKTLFNLYSLISNRTIFSEQLEYPLDQTVDQSAYNYRDKQYDTTSMIPWCALNNGNNVKTWHQSIIEEVEPCNLFQPVVTNNGLCHSFNAKPIHSMLSSSYFLESFKEAFNEDLFDDNTLNKGTGIGPKHALHFILTGDSIQRKNLQSPLDVSIRLTSRNEYIDIESVKKNVKPGLH